ASVVLNVYFIVVAGRGVWGFLLSKVIVAAISASALLSFVFWETGFHFRQQAARRMVRFGVPLMLSSASIFIIHFSDRFFLNHFTTLGQIGIYALAYKFGFLVTYFVGQPFSNAWTVSLYAHVTEEGWRERFGRVADYLVFFLVLAAAAISIFGGAMLTVVVDRTYWPAAFLIPIIAFAYAFREIRDFYRDLLFINKRTALFGTITSCCAVLNLILNWVLIGAYGVTGAAWATLATWAAYMSACWCLAYREHRVSSSARRFVTVCGFGGMLYYSSTFFHGLPTAGRLAVGTILMVPLLLWGWKAVYSHLDARIGEVRTAAASELV